MEIFLNWTDFKTRVLDKEKIKATEGDTFYNLYCPGEGCTFSSVIIKDNGSDHTDFSTNYLSYVNKNIVPKTVITSAPDPAPFAQPTYRTKRAATANLMSVAAGAVETSSFQLAAERYASGGALVISNAELGDFVEAWINDDNGIIPSPYRAALCEAWPIVASYIEKEWILVDTPGSVQAGAITKHILDTAPLNAKISAGLFLKVKYTAVNSGLTRTIGINYNMTKKL